jgi:hypothetical protein
MSGQFTSTVKDSLNPATVGTNMQSVAVVDSVVSPNTMTTTDGSDKHFKLSGQFTSTVKASLSVGAVFGETQPRANQPDGKGNSTLAGRITDKLFHISGQFSSTIKDSLAASDYGDSEPEDCNIDGAGNTSWCTSTNITGNGYLYLQSGHFTSTVKLSINVVSINNIPTGISWAGYDTLWSGVQFAIANPKLYRNSGQFTTTIHDSQSTGANGGPRGVVSQNYPALIANINQTKTFTVDARLKDRLTKTFAVDARVNHQYTKEFTADGSLGVLIDFTADAYIVGRGSRSFTVDCDLIILPGNPAGNRPDGYDPDLGSPDYHNYLIVLGHKVVYFGEF